MPSFRLTILSISVRTLAVALLAALPILAPCAGAQDAGAPPAPPSVEEQQALWQQPRLERLLGEQGALFQQSLDSMGLAPEDFRIDVEAMNLLGGQTRYRLPIVDAMLGDPWQLSHYSHAIADGLLDQSGSSADVLVAAQARLGQSVRLNIPQFSPLTRHQERVAGLGPEAFGTALYELTGEARWLDPAEYAQVPPPVAEAAALFCFVLPEVLEYRRLALELPMQRLGLDPQETFDRVLELAINRASSVTGEEDEDLYEHENVALLESLADNVDFSYLNAGATLLAVCVEDMAKTLQAAEAELAGQEFQWAFETEYGCIWLLGAAANTYPFPATGWGCSGYLLTIDTGGDDFYLGPAGNTSWANPVSVSLDLSGDDLYHAVVQDQGGPRSDRLFSPSQGCGVFGYGMQVDLAGNDRYSSSEFAQGCGIFGVGILRDAAGNDSYLGTGHLQGSGWFGSGILIDNAGNDSYYLFQFGQGYGGTLGVGVLLDCAGDDTYYAEPGKEGDAPFSGPHSPVINLNFAQGFAFGRRGDLNDGHSWAGGIGILVDGAGDDNYTAGIYALGSAYWHALGICVDKSGNDSYMSAHYTLGAPPHFAVGCFIDCAGDDRYTGYLRQSIGHARDFSLGWFEDGGGNDLYQAGMLSLGAGDECAIGVLWDKGGDDTYLLWGEGLGQTRSSTAAGLRSLQLCAGLFVDGSGHDRYLQLPANIERPYDAALDGPLVALSPFPMMGNGMLWTRGDSLGAPHARSAGVDAE